MTFNHQQQQQLLISQLQQQQQQHNPNFQQPIIITTTQETPTHKSCGLITIGLFEQLLSLGSMGLALYVIDKVNNTDFAVAELVCGGFFFIAGNFALYGGCNVWKRQCVISTAAILGVLGTVAAAVAIVFNVIAIQRYPTQCAKVDVKLSLTKGITVDDNRVCYLAYGPIHVGLIGLAVLEAVIGLIISCVSCCNVCSCCCCHKEPPSTAPRVFQPPISILPPPANYPQRAFQMSNKVENGHAPLLEP